MHPSGLDISSPRRLTKDIDKTCMNPFDIKVARHFLISFDPHCDPDNGQGLDMVVNWLQVNSCILCRRN
jgi:hypothetical protein